VRRNFANTLAGLRRFAVPELDLLNRISGDTAGYAVLVQRFHKLGLGSQEHFGQLTKLVSRGLSLASSLQRLATLCSFVSVGK
jgi:hypothetical protein